MANTAHVLKSTQSLKPVKISPLWLMMFPGLLVAEIWLLIQIGSRIGAGWTLLLLLASAVLGMRLVKGQGLNTAAQLQASLARGESPALHMFEGLSLLVAGVLLIIPGFLTDIAAFTLLIPPIRRMLFRAVLGRAAVVTSVGKAEIYRQSADESPTRAPLEGKSKRLD